jgi:hypothetical protein
LRPPHLLPTDPNGNLTGDGSSTDVYDTENRLTSASGVKTASLKFDPLGRLNETSGGTAGVTRLLYDGDALVGEYDAGGTLLRRYVHGPGVDERRVLNGIVWVLRSCAPWRDLPERYGPRTIYYSRFVRQ